MIEHESILKEIGQTKNFKLLRHQTTESQNLWELIKKKFITKTQYK